MTTRFLDLLALPLLVPALAAQEAPPASLKPAVWQGYLFRSPDGDLRIGWNVVAMGVMAQAPHRLAPALAEKLAPLASPAKSDWTFLNYLLEKEDVALATVPRVLVKLRGKIEVEGGEEERALSSRGQPCTMHEAKLETVEFVPEAWLDRWAVFFRDKRSPFRVARDTATAAELAAFAPKALATLRAMRAVPGASDAERDKVQAIDRDAKIVESFRRDKEYQIQRWLIGLAKEKQLELEGLDQLGPLPPSSTEIQRLFLTADGKQAFLDLVAKEWPTSPDDLTLVHYVTSGASTSAATTAIADVKTWSEEEFDRHQTSTRSVLGGR